MSSNIDFVKFVVDQMREAGEVTYRKMFGEYALYCNGKVVALICDEKLFVKPTAAGRSFIKGVTKAHPYPGAKPYFLIEDKFEDRDWISSLIRVTAAELPAPNPEENQL